METSDVSEMSEMFFGCHLRGKIQSSTNQRHSTGHCSTNGRSLTSLVPGWGCVCWGGGGGGGGEVGR